MIKLLKNTKGSMSIIFIGLVFTMLLMSMLILEMFGVYHNYFVAESILQRSANSAVEKNMLDEYKADHILKLDVEGAKEDFIKFATEDLDEKYSLNIENITLSSMPCKLQAKGEISFQTMFSKYGFNDVSYKFIVEAQNVRID